MIGEGASLERRVNTVKNGVFFGGGRDFYHVGMFTWRWGAIIASFPPYLSVCFVCSSTLVSIPSLSASDSLSTNVLLTSGTDREFR